jgi:hypothetical protein
LSLDQGIIIAKRSISLSKTYLVIGIFLAFMGALISSLSGVVGNLSSTGIPINATSTGGPDITSSLPLISVALQVFAAIIFATPILLLYVYDKNNGVLEYFLSLGMSQGDIYKQYLKAALMLSSVLIVAEVFVNIIAVLITGANVIVELEVSGLIVALALPVVS